MTHVMVGPDLTPQPCACDAEIDHGRPLADDRDQPCLGERIDGVWDTTWCNCEGCRDYNHELEEG